MVRFERLDGIRTYGQMQRRVFTVGRFHDQSSQHFGIARLSTVHVFHETAHPLPECVVVRNGSCGKMIGGIDINEIRAEQAGSDDRNPDAELFRLERKGLGEPRNGEFARVVNGWSDTRISRSGRNIEDVSGMLSAHDR